jgi:hypothetical protein
MRRRVKAHLADAERRHDLLAILAMKTACGLVWLFEDELETARIHAREACSRWDIPGFALQKSWFLLAETWVHLYAGDGPAAWETMLRRWPGLEQSLMLHAPFTRGVMLFQRGCTAVACAKARGADGRPLLRQAWRDARAISALKVQGLPALADLLRAAVASQRGQTDRAIQLLAGATARFDEASMKAHMVCARYRLAQLQGGETGRSLLAEVTSDCHRLGIRRPDRLVQVMAPGFPE